MRRVLLAVVIGLFAVSCSGDAKKPSGGAARAKTASVGDKVAMAGGDSVRVYSYAPDIPL